MGETVVACVGCQRNVIAEVARKTQKRCLKCWHRDFDRLYAPIVLREGNERVVLHPAPKNPPSKRGRKTGSPEVRSKSKTATRRAQSRLAQIFPEIFEVLLADERAKLGLEAWSIDRVITPHIVDPETFDLVNTYHRGPHGTPVDPPAPAAEPDRV